ncbi:MAG: glycerol-3-phosphate 1-O-acyltransferase PlsY [Alphaproteobacteria bacterium]|nr:glycerol-3-phosphate 1-O-acyltransferase PlsY [Alphaproteobacteria bacterium]
MILNELTLNELLIWSALGYFIGSIPSGLLLTRLAGSGDIRKIGSGNIGTTNVLRTGHKGLAALTLAADISKAFIVVFLAQHFSTPTIALCSGAAVFIGHVLPVWLGFKGGKGVAVYIGVLLALHPLLALIFGIIWGVMAVLYRMSSLSALTACLLIPFAIYYLADNGGWFILSLVLSIFTFATHRANIKRLLRGEEPKIGQ